VDIAAPYAVEQLLAAEYAPWMLEKELQQTILCRTEIDRAAGAGGAAVLALEFNIAIGKHRGEPFGTCAAQQAPHPRQQFRHRERLDDVIVGAGRQPP